MTKKIDDNWREPSEKAAREISEHAEDFASELVKSGPPSEFSANERVELGKGARLPSGTLEGREGRVVGQSFIAGPDSPHKGELCRGVELSDGRVVTTPEKHIRRSRSAVGYSHISQERWDAIFGRD